MIDDLRKDFGSWPAEELEFAEECPACHSEHRVVLHENLRDLAFRAAPGSWTMATCSNCESGYLIERPTRSSIGRAYTSYYTHTAAEDHAGTRSIWSILENGHANRRWNLHRIPASNIGGLVFPVVNYWRYRVNTGQRFRDLDGAGNGRKLLDVGCGNGHFLKTAVEAGWDAEGVDFDQNAVTASTQQGLKVVLGGIEHYSNREEEFDEIMLSHVIEHVYDPNTLINACYRLLKTGGRIWIETPNIQSHGQKICGEYWRGLEPPRHLVVFSRNALISRLEIAGFRQISDLPWRPTFPWMLEVSRQLAMSDGNFAMDSMIPFARKVIVELMNLLSVKRREFITLAAIK